MDPASVNCKLVFNRSVSSYDELVDWKDIVANQPLGSGSPHKGPMKPCKDGLLHGEYCLPVRGGFFEITLNHPRTDKFALLTQADQKKVYSMAWSKLLSLLRLAHPADLVEADYYYEFCKSGHVHLHGWMLLGNTCQIVPIGYVADLVKTWLNVLPSIKYHNYKHYSDKSMSKVYCRYESPSICCTYRYLDETEDIERWKSYCLKSQAIDEAQTAPEA